MSKKLFFKHKKPLTPKSAFFGEGALPITTSHVVSNSAATCTRSKPGNCYKTLYSVLDIPRVGGVFIDQYRTRSSKKNTLEPLAKLSLVGSQVSNSRPVDANKSCSRVSSKVGPSFFSNTGENLKLRARGYPSRPLWRVFYDGSCR